MEVPRFFFFFFLFAHLFSTSSSQFATNAVSTNMYESHSLTIDGVFRRCLAFEDTFDTDLEGEEYESMMRDEEEITVKCHSKQKHSLKSISKLELKNHVALCESKTCTHGGFNFFHDALEWKEHLIEMSLREV